MWRYCDGKVEVAPNCIKEIVFKYIRIPKNGKIVMKYPDSDCEDVQVIDKDESVDFEWAENVYPILFAKLLGGAGRVLKDAPIINISGT